MLVEEAQRVAKMRDRDRRVFEFVFVHEMARHSDMYNNKTVLILGASSGALTWKRIFVGGPVRSGWSVSLPHKAAHVRPCRVLSNLWQDCHTVGQESRLNAPRQKPLEPRKPAKLSCIYDRLSNINPLYAPTLSTPHRP